ncbi:uncharacterized protein LOC126898864 [Daktulosphaira vitifoliae]|uniref:uncharacterized protein LOC126898864 n=1 Tax=Daktulosphaira vitifoliae TaxID=58002 RepID=UPI0021AAD2A1|nr:uncharacterized protein LOC126898864 [Daktulosphaira vitifoliae]
MSLKDNEEFKFALRDIVNNSFKLESQFDRVRCAEWVHKLTMLPDDSLENIKIRNDYIQYLRIMIRAGIMHGIFSDSPPPVLAPFPEAIGKHITTQVPSLPPMGPINVYMKHWSPDGRAYVAIKPIPGKGVLTYLSVTPQPDGSHS